MGFLHTKYHDFLLKDIGEIETAFQSADSETAGRMD
jgi:hypothetical protein